MQKPTKRQATGGGIASIIIAAVLAVEGGYVNNPLDPGGETNHGVTIAVARQCGYTGPMKHMTADQAASCYMRLYIERPGYAGIVSLDPWVTKEMVDTGVNTGTYRASLWFQESLNHLNNRGVDFTGVAEDGLIGPNSVTAFQALQKRRGKVRACQLVVKLMDAKQAQHYMRLASNDSKFETFMVGWTDHRVGNVRPDQCGTAMS